MHDIERRALLKGAAAGALAFSVGGAEVLLTPCAARAQGVALRTLSAAQAAMAEKANGRWTVPQVFIGDTHVGGCDDLRALESTGKLDALLAG